MKQETKSWLLTFLAGFLATVLGIALTFGIESRTNASKRAKTARLLAEQIVENMDRTYQQLNTSTAFRNSMCFIPGCSRSATRSQKVKSICLKSWRPARKSLTPENTDVITYGKYNY